MHDCGIVSGLQYSGGAFLLLSCVVVSSSSPILVSRKLTRRKHVELRFVPPHDGRIHRAVEDILRDDDLSDDVNVRGGANVLVRNDVVLRRNERFREGRKRRYERGGSRLHERNLNMSVCRRTRKERRDGECGWLSRRNGSSMNRIPRC